MDFALPADQQALASLTRSVVDGSPAEGLWPALARAGVLAAGLPEAAGGSALGALGHCAVLVELGRAAAPTTYLWSVLVAGGTLAAAGRTSDAARIADGSLLATAALQDAIGETPASAVASSAGWELSGRKAFVPYADGASLVLVAATDDDGSALFAIAADELTGRLAPQVALDGDRVDALDLDGLVVPASSRLGPTGDAVEAATLGACAYQVGVLERAVELTAAYANERTQFGKPIGGFQAVAQRLADAHIDVAAVRLTMWEAAWRISEELPHAAELATAKFWAADAGHRVAHTAVHVHGGAGIDLDGQVQRYFTAAKRAEFTMGPATEQLLTLGALLAC